MIEDIKKYLVGITVGIRFGPTFSIIDEFGDIADEILYKKDSFFNEKIFSRVNANPLEMILENENSGDNLIITSRELILTCNLNNSNITQDSKLSPNINSDALIELNKSFEKDVINAVMKEHNFVRISRIGYINKYIINVEGLPDKFINKTIGDTLEGITDINVRFSKKYPTMKGLTGKDAKDYHNVIFAIIKKADKKELFISTDYQAYYDPSLESMRDMDFSDFLSSMESYNSKTFLQWLNKHYGVEVG